MRNTLVLVLLVALAAGLLWLACSEPSSRLTAPEGGIQPVAKPTGLPPGIERAMAAQEAHNPRLLGLPGVVGTAVGLAADGTPAVLVLTLAPGVAGIPSSLDDVPVVVKVTGAIRALKPPSSGKRPPPAETIDPTDRFPRPVPIGVSTGNEGECSAGTIGARVTDGTNVYALSNNHVYALENGADIRSTVLQPGRYDTGCATDPEDAIGTLFDFVPIDFGGALNTVDAAIALSSTGDLGNATPTNGYGTPSSTVLPPALRMEVQKYGRTTALTKGQVTGINARVLVGYTSGTARFENQIIVEARKAFIKAGDSGSLLVTDPGKNPVGLLFAGDGSGRFAVANPIQDVLDAFGVSIDDTPPSK